jgi:hypothetical protein
MHILSQGEDEVGIEYVPGMLVIEAPFVAKVKEKLTNSIVSHT